MSLLEIFGNEEIIELLLNPEFVLETPCDSIYFAVAVGHKGKFLCYIYAGSSTTCSSYHTVVVIPQTENPRWRAQLKFTEI